MNEGNNCSNQGNQDGKEEQENQGIPDWLPVYFSVEPEILYGGYKVLKETL